MRYPVALALTLALALGAAGCPDDSTPGTDGAPPDAAPVDAAAEDAAVDAGGPTTCLDQVTLDQIFDLDPDGPGTHIHVHAAFDGDGIWLTWCRPDGQSYFDIWAQRLGCDGTPTIPPFQVNTTDQNEIDPSVAVGDGNLLIVWQADNNTGINNMDIFVRTYGLDGSPLMASDATLETTWDSTPVVGNLVSPVVTPRPGGGFAVAGARGIDGAPAWQVFLQYLNADGSLDGTALDPRIDPTATQTYPDLAAAPDGTVNLAWTRSESGDEIFHTTFAPGSLLPDPDPPVAAAGGNAGDNVALATCPDCTVTYLAYDQGGDVLLTTADPVAPEPAVVFSGGLGPAHTPLVQARPTGGALVHFARLGGIRNELHIAPFTHDAGGLTAGSSELVTTAEVMPYPPAFVWVGGNVYFVAWTEGESPDYRIYGKFMEVVP